MEDRGLRHSFVAVFAMAVLAVGAYAVPVVAGKSLDEVSIQLKWKHQFQFAGFYAAIEKGFYEEAGLDVTLIEGGPGIDFIEMVVSGEAEYGVEMPDLLLRRGEGEPVVVLACIYQHSPIALMSLAESNIYSPHDLIGRKIMLGAASNADLRAMISYEGIEPGRIEIIDHSFNMEDLIDGKTDAMSLYSTAYAGELKSRGIAFNLLAPNSYGVDFYGDCLFTSEDEIEKHPVRVRNFRAASLKGWEYAMNNPEEIAGVIHEKYAPGKSVEVLVTEAEQMEPLLLHKVIEIGHINPGRWKHIGDTFVSQGMLDSDYSLEGFIYEPFGGRDYHWFYVALSVLAGVVSVGALARVWNKRLHMAVSQRTRELGESEERFKGMFANISSVVAIYKAIDDGNDFIFIDFNPAGERIEKISAKDVIGKAVTEVFPGVEEFGLLEVFRRVWQSGKAEHYPVGMYHDGRIQGWRENFIYRLASGEIVAIYDDITERKQAETALSESHERFEVIMDSLDSVVYVADFNTYELLFINKYGRNIWGDIVGEKCWQSLQSGFAGPCEFCTNERLLDENGKSTGVYTREFQNTVNNRWYECHDQAIPWTDGHLVRMEIATDITDRKLAEEELRVSQDRFLKAFHSSPDTISISRLSDGLIIDVNEAFEKMFGISREAAIGQTSFDLEVWAELPERDDLMARVRSGQSVRDVEYLFRRSSGDVFDVLFSCEIIEIDGETCLLSILRDITDRKRAEEALQQSEKKYRTLVSDTPAVLWTSDQNGHTSFISSNVKQVYGYTPEEILNAGDRLWFDRIHSDDLAVVKAAYAALMANGGDPFDVEYRIQRRDGDWIWLHDKATRSHEIDGKLRADGVFLDVTDRKQVEEEREQLIKTLEFKNRELQDVVYTASHDLRSPLVNIEGFGGELKSACGNLLGLISASAEDEDKKEKIETLLNEDIPESLSFITGSVTKMSGLLDGLLQVSRIGTVKINRESIDMNTIISLVLGAMEYQIKENDIAVSVDSLGSCPGDASMLDQVFTNLIGNAIKYSDPTKEKEIHISGKANGNMNIYCVEDNGMGIASNHQAKIFEIFHRLNPNDNIGGEGLGLTIVTRILDRMGGTIRVESEVGKGSKFFVGLPRVS